MLLNQIPFCLSNPSQNRNTLKEKKAQYDFGTHMVPSKRAGESAVQFFFVNGDVNAAFLEENSRIWSLPAGNFVHVGLVGTWYLRWRVTNWL